MEVWDSDMRTEHMKMMMRHNETSPAGLQVMSLCFLCCSLTDRRRWTQQHQSDSPNRFYQRTTPTGGDVLSSGRGRLQSSRCSFSFVLVTWKLKIILLLGQKINNCVFVVSRRKPEKRSDKSAQILSKEEIALWVNITFRFVYCWNYLNVKVLFVRKVDFWVFQHNQLLCYTSGMLPTEMSIILGKEMEYENRIKE